MRDAPTTFDCAPTLNISSSYHDYVESLKARLEKVSKTVLDLQAMQQLEQQRKQNQKVKSPSKFREGLLVYLLSPTTSALQTKSRKIRLDFVGPLVITKLLDRSHAVLSTLDGKQLTGIFHVCRLKVAWIRTTKGPTNLLSDLSPAEITASHHPVISDPRDYDVIRGKFSNGDLHILVDFANPTQRQWINLGSNNELSTLFTAILKDHKVRIQGSYQSFVNSFFQLLH
jgi:hypothetical protein